MSALKTSCLDNCTRSTLYASLLWPHQRRLCGNHADHKLRVVSTASCIADAVMCHMTSGSKATVRAIELLACTTLSSTTLFMDIANFVPEACYHPKPIRDQQKKVLEPICSPTMGDTGVFDVVCLNFIDLKLVHLWFSSCGISLCFPFSPWVLFLSSDLCSSAVCLKVCIHGVTLC